MWNPKEETLAREELSRLQNQRLRDLVARVYERVPFYRRKMKERGLLPSDIRETSDIAKLPFTTKDEMRDVYPLGLLAIDPQEIVEIHTSSGTTGKSVVDAYTPADLDIWAEVMARTLGMGGVTRADVIQNAYGYGLFTGGLGVHYGARRIGAAVIPISGGNTRRQLQVMKDFQSTVLACTPSYGLYLAEAGREEGFDFSRSPLRVGFFGAEPWSENMRREIEANLHLDAFDIYGLTEIIGPGVSAECPAHQGLHVFEDHFFPEIVDPVSGERMAEGEKGELVITTLTKEGTPVIRYRTRDITYLSTGRCSCGRTHVRMHRLLGRTDDMLIIRGVNVFPSQIEQVLFAYEGIEPHYQLVVDRSERLDTLEVQVEMNDRLFSDEIKRLEQIERDIEKELYATLNIHTKVKLVEPKSIARSEGKAKRVVDRRQM